MSDKPRLRELEVQAKSALSRLHRRIPDDVAAVRSYIAELKKIRLRPEYDWSRPNVHRLNYLAVQEILGSKDRAEAPMRDWLRRRLGEEARRVSAIPRKLEP
jgi:hypothetical protein